MTVYFRKSQISDLAQGLYIGISARKLINNADIDLCTIREGGGDTTETFKMLQGSSYLNTEAVGTFLNGESGSFAEWNDQVNNARKFIQTTTSDQPLYVENAINNKVGFESEVPVPALKSLVLSSALNYSTPATIFCVIDKVGNQGTSSPDIMANSIDGNAADFFTLALSTTFVRFWIKNSANQLRTSDYVSLPAGKYILIIVCDGIDNIKLYANGALLIDFTVTGGFLNTFKKIILGAFGGLFSEHLIYDSVLSSNARNKIETNLNNFYNIY